eukprot:364013-Chlamydomonas_euryale.AAC.14
MQTVPRSPPAPTSPGGGQPAAHTAAHSYLHLTYSGAANACRSLQIIPGFRLQAAYHDVPSNAMAGAAAVIAAAAAADGIIAAVAAAAADTDIHDAGIHTTVHTSAHTAHALPLHARINCSGHCGSRSHQPRCRPVLLTT